MGAANLTLRQATLGNYGDHRDGCARDDDTDTGEDDESLALGTIFTASQQMTSANHAYALECFDDQVQSPGPTPNHLPNRLLHFTKTSPPT